MSDARLEILKMVADKKITPEEAERLIRALDDGEGSRRGFEGAARRGFFGFADMIGGFGEMVHDAIEEAASSFGFAIDRRGLSEVSLKDGVFHLPEGLPLEVEQTSGHLKVQESPGDECQLVDGKASRMRVFEGTDRAVIALGGSGTLQIPSSTSKLRLFLRGGHLDANALPCFAEVRSFGGNVSLTEVRRPFAVRSFGGNLTLDLTTELAGSCEGETMGGNTRLHIPDGLPFRLEASSLGGEVVADPEIGEVSRDRSSPRMHVVLERGDAASAVRIRLKTAGGKVSLKRKV